MELAHSTFWPDCSCCWLLGYSVHPEHPELWAQRMTDWDPLCVKHPRRPDELFSAQVIEL